MWALAGVISFCGCGLCGFGDHGSLPEIVPTNHTSRSLYLRFDSGRGFTDASGELPIAFGREYHPDAWDPPQVGRRYRIRVYSNEFSERTLCQRDLTSEVAGWKEDIQLSVEPIGEGCRIVVDRVPITPR